MPTTEPGKYHPNYIDQERVIHLWVTTGLEIKEIASRLGASIETVRKKLRAAIDEGDDRIPQGYTRRGKAVPRRRG